MKAQEKNQRKIWVWEKGTKRCNPDGFSGRRKKPLEVGKVKENKFSQNFQKGMQSGKMMEWVNKYN